MVWTGPERTFFGGDSFAACAGGVGVGQRVLEFVEGVSATAEGVPGVSSSALAGKSVGVDVVECARAGGSGTGAGPEYGCLSARRRWWWRRGGCLWCWRAAGWLSLIHI